MSRQYKNFGKKVGEFNITVLTTEAGYLQDVADNTYPTLKLQCPQGHKFSMKVPSLYNKLAKCKKENLNNLCSECDKPEISGEELQAREKCEQVGLTFISFNKTTRSVEYECPCGNVTFTHARNILRDERKAQCPKCQNNVEPVSEPKDLK